MEWWVQCENNPTEITRHQLIKEAKYTHQFFNICNTFWTCYLEVYLAMTHNSFRIHCTLERKEKKSTRLPHNSIWSESSFFLQKSPWFTTWIKSWSHFFFPSVFWRILFRLRWAEGMRKNNRYIPVSSACKTMATQSKRNQQPIKPNPQGLCAGSDVSRVEELVEAACSGLLPQELSSCSVWQKGNIESQTPNLLAKQRWFAILPDYCELCDQTYGSHLCFCWYDRNEIKKGTLSLPFSWFWP